MDRGARQATVHGVQESGTTEQLSTLLVTFTTQVCCFYCPGRSVFWAKKDPQIMGVSSSNLSLYDLVPLMAQAVALTQPSDMSRIGDRSWSLL